MRRKQKEIKNPDFLFHQIIQTNPNSQHIQINQPNIKYIHIYIYIDNSTMKKMMIKKKHPIEWDLLIHVWEKGDEMGDCRRRIR